MSVRTGIDWSNVDALGTVPDAWLARRLGVAPSTVGVARRRLGIEPIVGVGRPSKETLAALAILSLPSQVSGQGVG